MQTFDLVDGKVVLWLFRASYLPVPIAMGDMETFSKFVDEAIEFCNSHSKTPIPLVYLKEFYDSTE